MQLITLDFESTYSAEYSLSKMTTEAYVRDPRFEAILCGFKVNDGPSFFIEGPRLKDYLPQLRLHECAVIMHHAHFDALILSHHYHIQPKAIIDTLGMARALYGANARLSLAKLCEREGIGAKGDEVEKVQGMRYADFSYQALHRYGQYCKNDVDRTYDLAQIYLPQFSREELEINDYVIRMFTEPTLRLDVDLLTKYAAQLKIDKTTLMLRAGANRDDLMSNPKFAQLLLELGIEPPMKTSLKTNKLTYAFAKTDPGMQALAEHPDENVQALIAARTGVKSTLAETRAERMIAMAANGAACLYLKYSGASGSHRLSGGDKMNWQNMTRGGVLRDALMAPEGQVVVVGDSSNIEARVLDKLAGQDDMVEVYRKADRKEGPDMYCTLAARIYKHPINKKDHPQERQMGKVAKLGLGFGMGHEKFRATVRAQAKDTDGKPLVIAPLFASEVVEIYRDAHPQVRKLWKRGDSALKAISQGLVDVAVDYQGIVRTCKDGIVMPGGLKILFPDLRFDKDGQCTTTLQYGEWTFWNGKTREHIYGAKFIENCIAGGTDVLTARGWTPIEQIQSDDLVHDGIDFVRHGGMIAKSVQECVAVDGVWMTPDHEVLTNEGWYAALEKPEPFRPNLRGVDCAAPGRERRQEDALGIPMRLRQADHQRRTSGYPGGQTRGHPELRLHDGSADRRWEHDARNVQAPCVLGVAVHGGPVHAAVASGVFPLWRSGYHGLQTLGQIIPKLLGGYGPFLRAWFNSRARKQRTRLQSAQLRMGDVECTSTQPTRQPEHRYSRTSAADRHSALDTVLSGAPRTAAHQVYDIVNAGPLQRFVVRGNDGPFIVHNCVQCLARIVVFDQCRVTAKQLKGLAKWVHSVHDEGIFLADVFDAPYVLETLMNNMRKAPDWFPNLPLNSEGGFHQRYGRAKA